MAWELLTNNMRKTIIKRQVDDVIVTKLIEAGVSPLLARLYAARGVKDADALSASLNQIIPPNQLTNSAAMAKLLADAIADKKKILIVGDYDADGGNCDGCCGKRLAQHGCAS